MWNFRMHLATGDPKFLDALENTLYNAILSGISLSGDRYFYANPLLSPGGQGRAEWFQCACCPHVARLLASLPGYLYATSEEGLRLNLLVGNRSRLSVGGEEVEVEVCTDYPWGGEAEVEVNPRGRGDFRFLLRIPTWVKGAKVEVNGNPLGSVGPGYVSLERNWRETWSG
jgi:DUF1680 family protein